MGKLTAYKKSRVDQRQFVLNEFRRGVRNGKDMYQRLAKAFKGDPALASMKTLYVWMAKFKTGDVEVEDRPRCGRPVTSEDARIFEAVERDPYVSITDLYCELDIARNTCKNTLARAGLINVNIMWVPRLITDEHRKLRIDHSLYMLQRQEREPFLDRVVFAGEKFITYNKYKKHFKTKDAKKVLRPTASQIAKSGTRPRRVVLHIWWTQQGLVMYKLLGEKEATRKGYAAELDELRQALEERPQADKPWILYHNRDKYCDVELTQKVADFGWEQMVHPKHCPDMSPTDFHVLQKFQFAFNTTLFTSFDEVQEFTFKYFSGRRPQFYQEAVDILPEKWHRIIETEGEYIATNEKV